MSIRNGRKHVDIPFEFDNNFIIIEVVFNNFLPLKFIFDTGAEYTILTQKKVTDLLSVDYQKQFTIIGADMKTELIAYLATGISMKAGDLKATNRSVLVLQEDYFQFDQFMGVRIHGIIGADFFRRFVVKIDYQRRKIRLEDPTVFNAPKSGYQKLPIEVYRNKPYLFAKANFSQDSSINLKLLIDTGASLSLLLHTNTHPGMRLPPKVIKSNIGIGMGGFLEGFMGRIDQLKFQDIRLNNIITNFQEVQPNARDDLLNGRNGILGNLILSRFDVIIDYVREQLYIRPNNKFKKQFKFDKSGLFIAASGNQLNQFTVFDMIPDSPAGEAGLKVGDRLKTINGFPANFFTLAQITRKLQKRAGKKIKLKIVRKGERIKYVFYLKDLI